MYITKYTTNMDRAKIKGGKIYPFRSGPIAHLTGVGQHPLETQATCISRCLTSSTRSQSRASLYDHTSAFYQVADFSTIVANQEPDTHVSSRDGDWTHFEPIRSAAEMDAGHFLRSLSGKSKDLLGRFSELRIKSKIQTLRLRIHLHLRKRINHITRHRLVKYVTSCQTFFIEMRRVKSRPLIQSPLFLQNLPPQVRLQCRTTNQIILQDTYQHPRTL